MEKRLTEAQFDAAVRTLEARSVRRPIGPQTLEIAHGVLVEGKAQKHYVAQLGVSFGAVSQAVRRVWEAHASSVPKGFERITVVLPEHQAFIVKRWAEEAKQRQEITQ